MDDNKLGRGLDYLLNISASKNEITKKIEDIDVLKIRKNRFQPRLNINDDSLSELISSIEENGVLQPILVRTDGDYYELIAGERRLKACLAIGMEKIPSINLDIPDNKLLQLAIIENIQRVNLNPIEESKAYNSMLKLENITHSELSRRVGKKRSTISNFLRLLDLPIQIQDGVSRGTITQGHARAILSLSSEKDMILCYKKIVSKSLSVRSTEKLVKSYLNPKQRISSKHNKNSNKHIHQYEEVLKEKFETKVKIKSKGNKGTIEFSFYSKDDFNKLYNFLSQNIFSAT